MAKNKYIVLRDELAPGESFEASTKPEFASADSKFEQHAMPDSIVPNNPDGPTGMKSSAKTDKEK